MTTRRKLPPGAKWVTLPSGVKRVEMVIDTGTDPGTGKRLQARRRFRSAEEALTAFTEIRTSTRDGSYVGRSGMTVATACDNWLAGRRLRASTMENYMNALKPVMRAYGEMPVQNLTKRNLDDLVELLQAGGIARADGKPSRPWKAASVNGTLVVFSMVLDDAAKQGLVIRNVARLVDRVPMVKKEMSTFTVAEVRTVLAKAKGDRLEHAWHLALSGLRRGEVCGLTWDDIDWNMNTLTIAKARVSVSGRVHDEGTKTAAGARMLPLTPALAAVLRRAHASQAAEALLAGAAYMDSGHLVRDEAGRAMHPEVVSDNWDRLLASTSVRRIRLHDARHTCGTLMHLDNVPIAVIAAWLGHADSAFTMRTYVHSQSGALDTAMQTLARVTSL